MKIKQLEQSSEQPVIENTENSELGTQSETDTFVIEENDDGSITFPLVDGRYIKGAGTAQPVCVTLRDVLTRDTTILEQFALKNKEAGFTPSMGVLKLISMLCIQWGDRTSITYEELEVIPLRKIKPDLKRLGKALEFFRLDDLFNEQ